MLNFKHNAKQKAISLLGFLLVAIMVFALIYMAVVDGSSLTAKVSTVFLASLTCLLFLYPCLFTLTYEFRADDNGITRKSGFRTQYVAWDNVAYWSLKRKPKANTFNTEPLLWMENGQRFGLEADIWYSSPNTAEARRQFLELVQRKLPGKNRDIADA